MLAENSTMTQRKLMEELGLSRKQIQKDIKKWQEEGILGREASNGNGCRIV